MDDERVTYHDQHGQRPPGASSHHNHDDATRAAVAEVMARIAGGEREAVWDLHALAEPALARLLRAEARRIDVRIGDDDIYDLTLDAAVEVGRLARAWRPDGALPWVWARRRITSLVHQHVGTFARELDESHLDIETPALGTAVHDPRGLLRRAARRHPSARQLEARLSAAVTDRDAQIWLGVQLERAAGNRSPAVTVAADHGMRPDAVRKVVQRVAERLQQVA